MLGNFLSLPTYLRKLTAIFSATFVGQLFPLLFYPILARIYSPADYSELGMYLVWVNIISIIGTLKLDQALLIPKTTEEAIEVAKFSTKSLFITSLVFFFILLIVSSYSFFFNVMVVIGAIPTGLTSIYLQLSNRYNFNKTIGWHKILLGSGSSILQVLSKFLSSGLIWGKLAGDILSVLPFYSRFFKTVKESASSKSRIIWSEFRGFITTTIPHNLFNIIGSRLPLFAFVYLGANELGGEYENVYRLGMAPITIIAQSLYLTFSAKFSELNQENKPVLPFLKKNFFGVLGFVGIPFLCFSFFAPTLLPLFLGEQWVNAGHFFLYLTPLMIATILTGPFVYVPQYVQKQGSAFLFEVLNNVLKFLGLIIGLQISNEKGLLLFSIFGASGYMVFICFIFYLSKKLDASLINKS